jgi:hypothetical protein
VKYSTIWSEDFTDDHFRDYLRDWLKNGHAKHKTGHATKFKNVKVGSAEKKLAEALARQLRNEKAILGVFDEGCMGMFNAIIPDELLNPLGIYKERLSQSALYYETTQVSDAEANEVRKWFDGRGMRFETGPNEDEHLTDAQILAQCKMYIAAMRIADDFGCHTVGIQYQQGLKDLLPASDLVEGTLNNADRPPVKSRDGNRVLYDGEPLPHFNEVDECAGLDGLLTYRVHKAMGQPVENTLHDLRWGDADHSGTTDDYVWVFLISGSAPPAHFVGGWAGATSERQPSMYFRLGGGTLKGISKPGEIVWSRFFIEGRPAQARHRPRRRDRTARSRDAAPLGRDHPAVADHARRHLRRHPRPDDGPPQGQPHPVRLRRLGRGRRQGPARQGRVGPGIGRGGACVRDEEERQGLGIALDLG